MGVEPLRAGAQRNLGRGPQRAIGAPSGDAAGPTETRARSLSYPRILLQSQITIKSQIDDDGRGEPRETMKSGSLQQKVPKKWGDVPRLFALLCGLLLNTFESGLSSQKDAKTRRGLGFMFSPFLSVLSVLSVVRHVVREGVGRCHAPSTPAPPTGFRPSHPSGRGSGGAWSAADKHGRWPDTGQRAAKREPTQPALRGGAGAASRPSPQSGGATGHRDRRRVPNHSRLH